MSVNLLFNKLKNKVEDKLYNLTSDERRIITTLKTVDLADYNMLLQASQTLEDIDKSVIVDCLVNHWDSESILYGMKTIEKVFQTRVKLNELVKSFFEDNRHWRFFKNDSEWLEKFNEYSTREITADDVAKWVDIDYVIKSREGGPGIDGFFSFVLGNCGSPYIVIEKLKTKLDCLTHIDVEDIVFWMTPYLKPDDFDMEKFFSRIDWSEVRANDYMDIYEDFFERFAPELVFKIPF